MNVKAIAIDDEVLHLLLLEQILNGSDIELVCFKEPLEALAYVKLNKIDVAFVDYLMPKMDGISLIRLLKKVHPTIEIILITSFCEQRDIKITALEAGVNHFLSKPLDGEEFSLCLKNILELLENQHELHERITHLEKEIAAIADTILDKKNGLW